MLLMLFLGLSVIVKVFAAAATISNYSLLDLDSLLFLTKINSSLRADIKMQQRKDRQTLINRVAGSVCMRESYLTIQ